MGLNVNAILWLANLNWPAAVRIKAGLAAAERIAD